MDTVLFLSKAMAEKKKIIVEGANAAMLDIDFGGCGEGGGTYICEGGGTYVHVRVVVRIYTYVTRV